jgi:hypothetical protein
LSALCVFDDRRCTGSSAGLAEAQDHTAVKPLTASLVESLIKARPAYSGLDCNYDRWLERVEGGRYTIGQVHLNDRHGRQCIDQLKAAGLLSVGECDKHLGRPPQCYTREVSARGIAVIKDEKLSFPCGKAIFGKVISVEMLDGGRAASVKYSATYEYPMRRQLNRCNIVLNDPRSVETPDFEEMSLKEESVERTFRVGGDGGWYVE